MVFVASFRYNTVFDMGAVCILMGYLRFLRKWVAINTANACGSCGALVGKRRLQLQVKCVQEKLSLVGISSLLVIIAHMGGTDHESITFGAI